MCRWTFRRTLAVGRNGCLEFSPADIINGGHLRPAGEMGQTLSTAEFGSEWGGDGDSGFKFDVNSDGQSFTLTFAEIQAEVGSDKSPDLITARAFSAVMPVHGDG